MEFRLPSQLMASPVDATNNYVLLAAVTALFLLLSTFFFWVFLLAPSGRRKRLLASGFAGPPPRFPLGNIPEMTSSAAATTSDINRDHKGGATVRHDIHSTVFPFFTKWRKTYGKVFVYWLGTEPFLYVGDPGFLKKVTSSSSTSWGKPDVFKHDRWPMFGGGLIMSEGQLWSRHRRLIVPAFSPASLNGMVGLMVESTAKMVSAWSDRAAAGDVVEVEVERDLNVNAAEIIAKASFGGMGDGAGKEVYEKLREMQSLLFMSNRLVGVPFSNLWHSPLKAREARKLGRRIDELLLSIISSRRRRDHDSPQSTADDLLGILLSSSGGGGNGELSDREIVDECKTFFFGGHETTALALSWTMLLLAVHPEWQSALREELMEVSGGRPIDSAMIPKLTKMGWVFKEVLRLYPPAPNSQRQAREDIVVGGGGGVVIPKGTNMWVDTVAMHHDPEIWGEDANEFRPERFAAGDDDDRRSAMSAATGYLPFGFGGRVCVGRKLTGMEYKVVLCMVLMSFSISVSPSYVHAPRVVLTLKPSHGVRLLLRPLPPPAPEDRRH